VVTLGLNGTVVKLQQTLIPEEQEQHESKKKKQRRDVSSETLTLCDTAENEYFYFNTLAKSSIA